ncbi:MAG: amidohydrolase [Actinomycetota bacterium]
MQQNGPADLAFVSGVVYTVDDRRPRAEAVAIRDGRIVGVGGDDEIRDHVGSATEVHDLAGRMLLPGFQDAHVHPPSAGVGMITCALQEAHARQDYLRIIKAYADAHPDLEWITGDGWAMDVFPGGTPTATDLDSVVPDRPALLYNRDGHGAWANTRALEVGGITAQTPDPPDGRIERGADGAATGTLHEGAVDLIARHVPPVDAATLHEGLRIAQAHLHSLGITAWQDAIVGYESVYDTQETYLTMARSGELTARVVAALWWDRHRGEEQIPDLIASREAGSAGRYRATTIKIMQDGVCENFTGALLTPYLNASGGESDNRGISFVEPEALKRHVTRLDREGFQVHFHAIGDRAVREALDAFETARAANGANDHRHHISHIQVVHPDDIPRFAALDVVANGQPLWAAYEPQMTTLTIPFLGSERASWQYPFGSLLRSGARLAFGSDWSVSSPDPLEEIHVAVNRMQPPDYPYGSDDPLENEPFFPDERISLDEALRAFTLGSAFVNHLDTETGSIEVGKLADLTVLDRDLFEAGDRHIAEASVQLTLVEGERVFEAPGFA